MKKVLAVPARVFRWIKKHWKLSLLIVLILVGVGFWQYKKKQAAVVQLKFETVQRTHLTEELSVSGVVDAKDRAVLRYAGGGKLTYLGAQEGDAVKKNQTLARIDASTLQKQMQQDLNSYFIQRLTYDQDQANRSNATPTDATSRQQQQDQATLNNSVLSVEIQDITIKNTVLSSPIDGILVSSPASVTGVNLVATDTFEVINPKSLVFRATVDQADISKVLKNQNSSIILDAYPDQNLNSHISYISFTSAQSSTGTVYVVEMPIEASGSADLNRYRIGMNGDASIVLNQKDNVLAVPLSALRETNNKDYVKVKTGPNSAEDREVKTGLETDTQVEVLSGLKEGDQVVVP